MSTRLRTRRLLLTPLTTEDVADLHDLLAQPDLRRAIWRDAPVREEHTRALIEWSDARFAERGYGAWGVRWHGTPEVVAVVIASPMPGAGEVEIVFGVDRDHRFNRVATEAVAAVVGHVTARGGCERVRAQVERGNFGAVNVARRAGLALEQIVRTATGELLRFGRLTLASPSQCLASGAEVVP